VQLWVPEEEENGERMTAAKFLSIYDKVARLISLDVTAEIRFEYGDENFPPPIITSKTSVKPRPKLRVQLRLPRDHVQARDRRQSGEACCG
jgi:hypothetical protein